MKEITQRARKLRQNQTTPEAILWEHLRGSKLGFRIVRQKPILFKYFGQDRAFIADFYCKEVRVIIEVDGLIHQEQVEYDQIRTELLSAMHYSVIRFTNDEIFDDVELVARSLTSFLRERREVAVVTEPVEVQAGERQYFKA